MTISIDLPQGSYTITGGDQGKRRLNLLAEIFQPTTLRLLKDAGLRSGDRCLDLGCGGGQVQGAAHRRLARRAGGAR